LHHLTGAAHAVEHIISLFDEKPGIHEDDVFLMNDSYSGALHAPDVYIIRPVHSEGKLIAFVATFVHVSDIGGIDPAGFCPSAREVYHEGIQTQGLKIIERGELREDIWNTFLNCVRDSGVVALDIKSMLAATHVAKERLIKIYSDYEFEVVDTVCKELIAESERLLRQRLLEIPDGVYRARQYYDYRGELGDKVYRVELAVYKEGDTITYDFTGTDEQAPIGINCCYWATLGGLFAPFFPLLCWDIPWNHGLTRPVKLIAPEGTLVNATRPAPVSIATIGLVNVVNCLSLQAISKMLGATEKYRNSATAVWHGTHVVEFINGLLPNGEFTIYHSTESFPGSGGARAFKDGVDNGGEIPNVVSRVANIETCESLFSLLYLYRRVVPDSGGPGKYRGGCSHEWGYIPYGSPEKKFTSVLMPGKGTLFTPSLGLFGGLPGCNADYIEFRESNASEWPDGLASTKGKEEYISFGVTDIKEGDIFYGRLCGGGGYGDPLDRDPELVLKDVLQGLVTNGPARDIYGVILDLDNKQVDDDATHHQRLSLRRERLDGTDPKVDTRERSSIPASDARLSEYLQVTDAENGSSVQCTWCGEQICSGSDKWKDNVASRKVSIAESGPHRKDVNQFFMLEYFCPSCATQLDVDVIYRDDPPIYDDIRRWPE
jgi:N-methylhydantoinase B